MTVTNVESQWLVRVMRTISSVTIEEPCLPKPRLAADRSVPKGTAEDVLRAAQDFIQTLRDAENLSVSRL
jgi:hypothetical protein